MNEKVKAIDFVFCKNKNHAPSISIEGEALFETGFLPDEILIAKIYDGTIIIQKAPVLNPENIL